jgi:phospholipid N-methyltransferase
MALSLLKQLRINLNFSTAIPTPAQAEAGNYRKDHIRIHGLDIAIETRKGRSRKPGWPKMACHYGYIKRTEGADGDHVDVMIGPHIDSELVVVVDQVNHKGKFDEHKCLIGFRTKQAAIDTYRRCYTRGWKVGPTTAMTVHQFKAWLDKGNQLKPIEKQVSQYAAKPSENQARWITTETGSHVLIGRDGTVQAGMGGKFNGKKLGTTESRPKPDYNKRLKALAKRRGESINDVGRPEKQLVDPSRQVAKKSPIVKDFASSTMAKIKAAEQAGPDIDQPSVKDHPLHHSQLSSAMQHALLEINSKLYGIVGKVGAAGSIAANAGADADQQREAKKRAWTGYEQETQHSPEIARVRAQLNLPKSINKVEGVDQSQVKSALSDLTKLIANAASGGTDLNPYVRFNNIIPRELAPKLKPNDDLFRPVKDHERFAALVQQFATAMNAASVERYGWSESDHPRDEAGRFTTATGGFNHIAWTQFRKKHPDAFNKKDSHGDFSPALIPFNPNEPHKGAYRIHMPRTNNPNVEVALHDGGWTEVETIKTPQGTRYRVQSFDDSGMETFEEETGSKSQAVRWQKKEAQAIEKEAAKERAAMTAIPDTYGADAFLAALTEQYAARRLKSQPGQQEFQWITVHPPGHEHGQPVLINKKDGTIQAGMGGNFNGQKISDLGKHPEPAKPAATEKKPTLAEIDRGAKAYKKQVDSLPEGPEKAEAMKHAEDHARLSAMAAKLKAASDAREAELKSKAEAAKHEPQPPVEPKHAHDFSSFDAEKHGGYKPLLQIGRDIDAGKLSIDEFKAAHALFANNRAAFLADMQKRFDAKQLQNIAGNMGNWRAKTDGKQKNAEHVYAQLMSSAFDIGDGISNTYSHDELHSAGQSINAAMLQRIAAHVDKQTPETLAGHVEKQAGRIAEREAEKKAADEAKANPQTLDDFNQVLREKKYLDLTPDQRQRYDELAADKTRAARADDSKKKAEVQKFEGEGQQVGFDLSKNYHSKRGTDIFTASPNTRVDRGSYDEMNAAAKRLGGWYYKQFGSTPAGFHFPTEEARDKFLTLQSGNVDRSQDLEQMKRERQMSTSDRLVAHADRLEERAIETLNADRKTNTARRAGMAASIEGRARQEIAHAQTLRKIADGLKDGKLKYLDGVTQSTHLEELNSVARRAAYDGFKSELNAKYGDYGNAPYSEREKLNGGYSAIDLTPDAADHAVYPYPKLWASEVKELAAMLKGKRGVKYDRASLEAMAERASKNEDRDGLISFNDKTWPTFKAAFDKIKSSGAIDRNDFRTKSLVSRMSDTSESMRRLKSAGIHNEAELRQALREYIPLKSSQQKEDPVRKAERALIGRKLDGFFPTPPSVIDKMLAAVDIQPGHEVLEPSAGKGDIVDQIKRAQPEANVKALEYNRTFGDVLGAKGHDVEFGDFMEHKGQYDRIVMNPPFENGADMQHVRHAYEQLKPGGKLVAIMAGGGTAKRQEFDKWVQSIGGEVEELPAGSFAGNDAFRQTGVNTKMVTIERAANGASKYSVDASKTPITAAWIERYAAAAEMYAARKPKPQKGQQEFRWITVHPAGHEHGQPVMIGNDGTIKAGMGGKFNGQKIGDMGKASKGEAKSDSHKAAKAELDEIDRKYHDYGYAKRFVNPGSEEHKRDMDRKSELREEIGDHFWQKPYAKVKASEQMPQAKHKKYVKEAIEAGKNVPAEVLADYPDLSPKQTTGANPQTTGVKPTNSGDKKQEFGKNAKAAFASGMEWKENKSGMLAWFKGDVQHSGAIDKDGPHYSNQSAEQMAYALRGVDTEEDIARKNAEHKKANQKNHQESHEKWKGYSIDQLNTMKQKAIVASKDRSNREFNENGGRRSGPAMLNQGAREAAETAAELGRYIDERSSRESVTGDKPAPAYVPPAIPGEQTSLFGGDDMNSGQKSLFNVARPSKADIRAAKQQGGPAPASLLEQIDDEQKNYADSRKSLPGQKDMFSADSQTRHAFIMEHYAAKRNTQPGQLGMFGDGLGGTMLRAPETQKKFDFDKKWDEAKHPRADDGKFATHTGSGSKSDDRKDRRQYWNQFKKQGELLDSPLDQPKLPLAKDDDDEAKPGSSSKSEEAAKAISRDSRKEELKSQHRQIMAKQDADDKRRNPMPFAQEWIYTSADVNDAHKELMRTSARYRKIKTMADDEAMKEDIPAEGEEFTKPASKTEHERQKMVAEAVFNQHPERTPDYVVKYFGLSKSNAEPKTAPAKANPFKQQADAIRSRAEALSPGGSARDKAMASAFPLGTGRPGNASSRRTSAQSARSIDRTVDNAMKALKLFDAAKIMEARAAAFDRGEINEHGGRTEVGRAIDAKIAEQATKRQETVKKASEHIADHMRTTLKPGDTVYIAGNPKNGVTIKRVNPKSITTESGSSWKYDELIPPHPDGRAMTTKEMVEVIKQRSDKYQASPAMSIIERYRASAETLKAKIKKGAKPVTTTGSFGDKGRFVTIDGRAVFIESKESVAAKRKKRDDAKAPYQPKTVLDHAIVEYIGNHKKMVEAFKPFIDDAYKHLNSEASGDTDALREVLSNFGHKGKAASAFISNLRHKRDYTSIPGFDEMAEYAKKYHPQLLAGRTGESTAAGDFEQAFFDRLRQGFTAGYAKHSPEVLEMAAQMAGSSFFDESNWAYDPQQVDDVPFDAYRHATVDRYSSQFADSFIRKYLAQTA